MLTYIVPIICIILIMLLLIIIPNSIRKHYAARKVAARTDSEKINDLSKTLEPYGFAYDIEKDIFYSKMDCWQREIGYCRFFDESAPMMNMIIESEPIYFQYDNRKWMIEFWKGQYGITTGAEVGVYVTDDADSSSYFLFDGPYFNCVSDDELLHMGFILRKKGKVILERKELHWWITGFKLAVFSKPSDLSMEILITFPNKTMRNAFLSGLIRAGYTADLIDVNDLTVTIIFIKPKTPQPKHHNKLYNYIIQKINKTNCRRYRFITRKYTRTIDQIDYLSFSVPGLYRVATKFSKATSLAKAYKKLRARLNQR